MGVNVGGLSIDTSQFGVPVDTSDLDFTNSSSNVESVWTANVSLITLVGLFVGLRVFVRSFMMRRIFLDDGMKLSPETGTIADCSLV
jgi:hypothetical protein